MKHFDLSPIQRLAGINTKVIQKLPGSESDCDYCKYRKAVNKYESTI